MCLSGGKRSLIGVIMRCGIEVAYASFSEDDFGVARVFFNLGAQAADVLLDKFRVSFIIWSPDTVEQVGTTDYASFVSY